MPPGPSTALPDPAGTLADVCDTPIPCSLMTVGAYATENELRGTECEYWDIQDCRDWNSARWALKACVAEDIGGRCQKHCKKLGVPT